jgi:hypothetical protein
MGRSTNTSSKRLLEYIYMKREDGNETDHEMDSRRSDGISAGCLRRRRGRK